MTTLKYILRDTWRLIVHHWVLGLLTLITAGVMLWILGVTTLFSLNLENLLSRLESELVVQAYLVKDNTLNVEQVAQKIQSLEYVYAMKIYSPSDTAVTTSLRKPKKKAKWKMPTILNKIMGIYMSSR